MHNLLKSVGRALIIAFLLVVIGAGAWMVREEIRVRRLLAGRAQLRAKYDAIKAAIQSGEKTPLFDLVNLYEDHAADVRERNAALHILIACVAFPSDMKIPDDDTEISRAILRTKWSRAAGWLRANRDALTFDASDKRWHLPAPTTAPTTAPS